MYRDAVPIAGNQASNKAGTNAGTKARTNAINSGTSGRRLTTNAGTNAGTKAGTNAGTKTDTLEHHGVKPLRQSQGQSQLELEPVRARASQNQPETTRAETHQGRSQAEPQEVHRPQAINLGEPGSGQASITRTAHSKPEDDKSQDKRRKMRDIAEEAANIQHAKGKYNVVAGTLSRPPTLRPEQSDEERLLITQNIQNATKRNETDSENTEKDFRVEELLPPCDMAVEVDVWYRQTSTAQQRGW